MNRCRRQSWINEADNEGGLGDTQWTDRSQDYIDICLLVFYTTFSPLDGVEVASSTTNCHGITHP